MQAARQPGDWAAGKVTVMKRSIQDTTSQRDTGHLCTLHIRNLARPACWRALHLERNAQGASNCRWRGQKTTMPFACKSHTWNAQSGRKQCRVRAGHTDLVHCLHEEISTPILGCLRRLQGRNLFHLVCWTTSHMERNADVGLDRRQGCCI